jgi:glycerophosphoryl diester phosphodiesterase
MAGLDWLIARPVAHRGLHDAQKGVIENTPSAFAAAIAGTYGIECDLQISADGEAMVYHDDTLDRLTDGKGRLDALTAAELKRLPFKATADRMLTLAELCELVAGRATLVVELKSRLTGDRRLVERAAKVLGRYRGPVALMSFDPAQIATLRVIAPQVPRGLVAESPHLASQRGGRLAVARDALGLLAQSLHARPQFIAYSVADLPATLPTVARRIFGLPLLTWTVRSAEQRRTAERYADQMIFEGFRP